MKYNAKKIDLTLLHMADALKDLGQRGFPRFNKEVDMVFHENIGIEPEVITFFVSDEEI